jgi:hypothetical protein
MSRRVLAAVAVLFTFTAFVVAAEIKGKVTKVDAENSKITVKVDDKDQEFTITKDTKIVGSKGKEIKNRLKAKAFSDKALERGIQVTITTEKKDDKEVVKEVKVMGGKKGKMDQ